MSSTLCSKEGYPACLSWSIRRGLLEIVLPSRLARESRGFVIFVSRLPPTPSPRVHRTQGSVATVLNRLRALSAWAILGSSDSHAVKIAPEQRLICRSECPAHPGSYRSLTLSNALSTRFTRPFALGQLQFPP